jgi:hypothetical protein
MAEYDIDDYVAVPIDKLDKIVHAVSGNTSFDDLGCWLPKGKYYILKVIDYELIQED